MIDSTSGSILENTLIECVNGRKQKTGTDKNGEFELSGLCRGEIELHISHLDCEHIHISFTLLNDSFIQIYLKHSEHELVGVKLSIRQTRNSGLSVSNLNATDIRKGNSISTMMQDIGSISILRTGNNVSKPMVNGLHGSRVLIINNGIRQEGQNWGMEHSPEIDGFLASEIELLKGAESLRYGSDGIGGVILIKPKSLFSEKSGQLQGEVNTIGNSNGRGLVFNAVAGAKHDLILPFYWRVQGTFKQQGNYHTPQYVIDNTGFREQNYSFNLGIKKRGLQSEIFYSEFFNKTGIYRGAQSGSLSDLYKAINSNKPLYNSDFTYQINRPFQWVKHRLIKFKNELEIDARNRIELSLSFQKNHRSEYDIQRSSGSFNGPDFDYYINTGMGELIWSRADFHKVHFKTGLFALTQSNAYTGRFFIPGFIQKSFAAFFIAKRQFGKFGTEASLRYDNKNYEIFIWNNNTLFRKQNNYDAAAYLFHLSWQASGKHRWVLTHSSVWRPPAVNELYSDGLHQGLATFEKGDSLLKIERSFSQALTYKFQGKKLSFEGEFYYQVVSGFINLIPGKNAQLTIRGAFPVYNYTQSDAILYGINFHTRYEAARNLTLSLLGKLPNGYSVKEKKPLAMMPAYNGKLQVEYKFRKIELKIWGEYTARQFRYTDSSDYLAPPPSYFIAGADLQWQFNIRRNPLRLGLGVTNLSNTVYRDYLNRFRYFIDEQGTNFIIRLNYPIQYTLNKKQHEH